jgi:hypothetical protein
VALALQKCLLVYVRTNHMGRIWLLRMLQVMT